MREFSVEEFYTNNYTFSLLTNLIYSIKCNC